MQQQTKLTEIDSIPFPSILSLVESWAAEARVVSFQLEKSWENWISTTQKRADVLKASYLLALPAFFHLNDHNFRNEPSWLLRILHTITRSGIIRIELIFVGRWSRKVDDYEKSSKWKLQAFVVSRKHNIVLSFYFMRKFLSEKLETQNQAEFDARSPRLEAAEKLFDLFRLILSSSQFDVEWSF